MWGPGSDVKATTGAPRVGLPLHLSATRSSDDALKNENNPEVSEKVYGMDQESD